jgi:spore coat protein U-like protein
MRLLKYALLLGASLLATLPASSTVLTTNFNVKITITNECKILTASDLIFGSHGIIDTNLDQTSTIGVQCTTGQTYVVGLGLGNGAGTTVGSRKMTGPGAAVVNYTLYQDGGHAQLWGVTPGTDTQAGTGNGSVQNLIVYGRVPIQPTPVAGDYADIVQVTLTY